jgi:K+-transporting ATPase A subunit
VTDRVRSLSPAFTESCATGARPNNGSAFAGYTGFMQPKPGNIGSHGITFGVFLIGVVILFALLTFLTELFLGPIVQGLTSHLY